MVLNCAMPVNYTPNSTTTSTSIFDLYKNLAIKKEEPLSDYEDGEDQDMNVDDAEVSDFFSMEEKELISWTRIHPQYWTKDEVLDWVYFVVERMNLDGSKVRGEAYQSITGSKLCRMTEEDFQATATDRSCGSTLFDSFKDLESHAKIRKPKSIDRLGPITLEAINQHQLFKRDSQPNAFSVSISINNNNNSNNILDNSSSTNKDGPSGLQLDFQSDNNTSKLRVFGQDNDVKVELAHLGVYCISTDIDLRPLSTSTQSSSSSSSNVPSSSYLNSRTNGSSLHVHQYFDGQQQQQQQQQQMSLHQHHQYQPLPLSSLPQLSPILSSLPPLQNSFLNNSYVKKRQYPSSSSSSTPCLSSFLSSSFSAALSSTSSSSFTSSSLNNSNNTLTLPRTVDFLSSPVSCDSPIQSSSSTPSSSSPSSSSVLPSLSTLYSSSSSNSTSSQSSSLSTQLSSTSSLSSTVVEISSSVDLMEVTDSDYISDEDLFVPLDMSDDSLMPPTNETGVVEKKRSGRKTKSSQGNKGNHLWEFVRDLLHDPAYNPRLLKWEDKENGVFRFVQSEAVAQLWGEKKKNPVMTYEKLSRAMRFCRSSGYFDSVPKNGKFPKKLCFMFGAKAHGWKN